MVEILYRAAKRTGVEVIMVANRHIAAPAIPNVSTVQVGAGFDVADNHIVEQVEPGDLVITADIPLASAVIDEGAEALNPRGDFYTRENIRQRLVMRDLMEELRGSGVETGGGPAALHQRDRREFANQLDRFLTKNVAP